MRILVIGAGEVGSSIAGSLADHHEIVVVDTDADKVTDLTYTFDVLAMEGDGTSLETLQEADVARADMVIASTDDDEANLVICSTAKVEGDPFTIARVRNTTFLRTWRRSTGVFGVDFMVCTNLLTAEAVVTIAGLPAARDVDQFAGGSIQMAEFEVPTDSPIANQTVSEADRWEALTFVGILDEDVTIPTGDTVIEPGSRVVVIGPPENVRAFAESLAPEVAVRDVFVIGGDDIGEEVARLLEERRLTVRLVEEDPDRSQELAAGLPDTVVMCHDATDVEFLLREHVDKADMAVISLASDERTLLVSLLARQIGTGRTVAIVENGEYVDLFEAVGVDVAVNPREVTAEEIIRFTHEGRTENVALVESDRAEVIEIEVGDDSALANRPLREAAADLPPGVVVGAITRDGEPIAPRGDTVVRPADHVVVFVDADVLDDVVGRL